MSEEEQKVNRQIERANDERNQALKERDHNAELLRITKDQMKLRIEERDRAREIVRKLRGYE